MVEDLQSFVGISDSDSFHASLLRYDRAGLPDSRLVVDNQDVLGGGLMQYRRFCAPGQQGFSPPLRELASTHSAISGQRTALPYEYSILVYTIDPFILEWAGPLLSPPADLMDTPCAKSVFSQAKSGSFN